MKNILLSQFLSIPIFSYCKTILYLITNITHIKKKFFCFIIILFAKYSFSQTCQVNEWIREHYTISAKYLALKEMIYPPHPFHNSVEIPDWITEKYLRYLSAIYDRQDSGSDSIFNTLKVHARLGFYPNLVDLDLDTNETWVKNLFWDANSPTGITALDSILVKYHLQFFHSIPGSDLMSFHLHTDSVLNPYALAKLLATIPGINSSNPRTVFTNGGGYNNITTLPLGNSERIFFVKSDFPVYNFEWEYSVDYHSCESELIYQSSYTTTGIDKLDITEIEVFPNPANHTIYLSWNNEQIETIDIELFDLSGKKQVVTLQQAHQGEKVFAVSSLSNGMYIFRIVDSLTNALVKQGRIIIMR